jgi:hypothetical protein
MRVVDVVRAAGGMLPPGISAKCQLGRPKRQCKEYLLPNDFPQCSHLNPSGTKSKIPSGQRRIFPEAQGLKIEERNSKTYD